LVWDGEVVGGGLGGFCGVLMMVMLLYGLFTVCILRAGWGVSRGRFGYFVMEVNGLWAVANHADTQNSLQILPKFESITIY